MSEIETNIVAQIDPNFDAVSAGEKLADMTAVLELHIHAPGFRKKLPAQSFTGTGSLSDTRPDTDPDLIHVHQDILQGHSVLPRLAKTAPHEAGQHRIL